MVMRRLPHQAVPYDDADVQPTTPRRQQASGVPSTRFPASPPPTALSALLGQAFGSRKPKIPQITTAPGQLGAGETETEADEPSSRLPTTRILPVSEPLVPPTLITMLLFESSRLLSVVPATCGVLVNLWCLWCPPGYSPVYTSSFDHPYSIPSRTGRWGRSCPPDRGDYFVAILWALLTAHQCLKLTTGLLHRWRAYYSPLSTLIRLLALQAICWPATHFTLGIVGSLGTNFNAENRTILETALLRWTTDRPDICWTVIGTTTCVSRSIQIWVTSNLLLSTSSNTRSNLASAVPDRLKLKRAVTGEETRKLTGRKWDWHVVARACILPAGCLYFVMAWVGAWRREVGGC